MGAIRNTFPVVFILMSLFFISIEPRSVTMTKTITDFCNHRKTIEDRSFCLKVFQSDPRSSTATDFLTILKISVDSAIEEVHKTQNFLVGISQKIGIKAAELSVVKSCITACDGAISQWHTMIEDFKVDPMTSTYDGMLVFDALAPCNQTLVDSKISEPEISLRIKVAYSYSYLNEDVATAGCKE